MRQALDKNPGCPFDWALFIGASAYMISGMGCGERRYVAVDGWMHSQSDGLGV